MKTQSWLFFAVVFILGVACSGIATQVEGAGGGSSGGMSGSGTGDTGGGGRNAGPGGLAGAGGTPDSSVPSCSGDQVPCASAACCPSPLISGGTFYRSYDGVTVIPPYIDYTSKAYPATVSDFRLDRYEITVRRFRKFVDAYAPDLIPPGAGRNPNNPDDLGWDPAWSESLPMDATELRTALKCAHGAGPYPFQKYETWTDSAGAYEDQPINCITWYEVFAFCAWDGGRLPTEAEWNYAAAGGSEQRLYPWGGEAPDCNLVQNAHVRSFCRQHTADVGSVSPAGDGRWGQSDLAGNVAEFTRDVYTEPYAQVSCTNCAALTGGHNWTARGGDFDSVALRLLASSRYGTGGRYYGQGSRCARSP
jgi:formylglycine-generating enzyme required for sulfatase activity